MILPRPAARDELPRDGLRQEKHGLQVDVHDLVPVALVELEGIVAPDDAGVVHQDVDDVEARERLRDDVGGTRLVEVGRDELEAPARGRDARGGLGGRLAADGHDVGAGARERDRERLAEARVRARHERGSILEAERRAAGGHLSWQMSRTFMSV